MGPWTGPAGRQRRRGRRRCRRAATSTRTSGTTRTSSRDMATRDHRRADDVSPDGAGLLRGAAAAPGAADALEYFDAVGAAAVRRPPGAPTRPPRRCSTGMATAVGLTDVTPEGYRRAASNESEPAPGDLAAFETALADGSADVLIYNSPDQRQHPRAAAGRGRGRGRAGGRGDGIPGRRRRFLRRVAARSARGALRRAQQDAVTGSDAERAPAAARLDGRQRGAGRADRLVAGHLHRASPARSSASSAPTARARRPCSSWPSACSRPPRAGWRCSAPRPAGGTGGSATCRRTTPRPSARPSAAATW